MEVHLKEGCKANIYVCERFIAALPSVSIGDNLWLEIDKLQGTTYRQFKDRIRFLTWTRFGVEYLPDIHKGFDDWGLEFVWYPTQHPLCGREHYEDWTGNILVRKVNVELTSRRYGASYWQVPDEWQAMTDMAYLESINERFEINKKNWGL